MMQTQARLTLPFLIIAITTMMQVSPVRARSMQKAKLNDPSIEPVFEVSGRIANTNVYTEADLRKAMVYIDGRTGSSYYPCDIEAANLLLRTQKRLKEILLKMDPMYRPTSLQFELKSFVEHYNLHDNALTPMDQKTWNQPKDLVKFDYRLPETLIANPGLIRPDRMIIRTELALIGRYDAKLKKIATNLSGGALSINMPSVSRFENSEVFSFPANAFSSNDSYSETIAPICLRAFEKLLSRLDNQEKDVINLITAAKLSEQNKLDPLRYYYNQEDVFKRKMLKVSDSMPPTTIILGRIPVRYESGNDEILDDDNNITNLRSSALTRRNNDNDGHTKLFVKSRDRASWNTELLQMDPSRQTSFYNGPCSYGYVQASEAINSAIKTELTQLFPNESDSPRVVIHTLTSKATTRIKQRASKDDGNVFLWGSKTVEAAGDLNNSFVSVGTWTWEIWRTERIIKWVLDLQIDFDFHFDGVYSEISKQGLTNFVRLSLNKSIDIAPEKGDFGPRRVLWSRVNDICSQSLEIMKKEIPTIVQKIPAERKNKKQQEAILEDLRRNQEPI